jgi:heat shock protein HslJ
MLSKIMFSLIAIVLLTGPLATPGLAQEPVQCENVYTVQAGDWLSKIAEKYYGDPLAFERIVDASNAQSDDDYPDIANPDLIEPGLVLCLPSGDVMAQLLEMAQSAPPGLSPQELANATYPTQYIPAGSVTLENGRFSESIAPGSATEIKINVTRHLAYGELNGQPAAAIVLLSDPGGSGSFYDLHVMASQDGQPVSVASTMLGDRVQINSMTIENNQIVVDMVQAGPDDPMCCPSQQVIKTFELQGDQLVEVSSQIVQDEGSSAPELVGPVWLWQQTLMNNDDQFIPDNPGNYNLQFNSDGTVAIQADCNRVGGSYTLDGSQLAIELGPSTLVACPEGSLGDQFVKNLGEANSYFFDGDDLIISLMFDSGSMRFGPQSNELAGTSWTVIGYNNGRGGVVSVIIGTELTAAFGEDGTLSGSAGCNTYNAGYEVDANNISIGLPISTMMACAEPEGIMEQEQEYLTALGTAATYQITGNRLEMRTVESSTVATFEAAR